MIYILCTLKCRSPIIFDRCIKIYLVGLTHSTGSKQNIFNGPKLLIGLFKFLKANIDSINMLMYDRGFHIHCGSDFFFLNINFDLLIIIFSA